MVNCVVAMEIAPPVASALRMPGRGISQSRQRRSRSSTTGVRRCAPTCKNEKRRWPQPARRPLPPARSSLAWTPCRRSPHSSAPAGRAATLPGPSSWMRLRQAAWRWAHEGAEARSSTLRERLKTTLAGPAHHQRAQKLRPTSFTRLLRAPQERAGGSSAGRVAKLVDRRPPGGRPRRS